MMPRRCVADASVIIKWFLQDEDDTAPARALLDASADDDAEILTVDLAFYEVGQVLLRRGRADPTTVLPLLAGLFDLDLTVVGLERALAVSAARVAADHGLSFYDAAYLAAARMLGVPLVTADRQLARAAGSDGILPAELT